MRVTLARPPFFLHLIPFKTLLCASAACAALVLSSCASNSVLTEKPASAKETSTPGSGAQTTTVTPLQKFLWIFSPYRPAIQQGNFISQEMLAQLKIGMTREQVRFIFGTPLLTDIFHVERWDYPFRLAKGDGEVTSSRVVVFFKDGKVERYEGGNLPTEKEYIARIAAANPLVTSPAEPAAPK